MSTILIYTWVHVCKVDNKILLYKVDFIVPTKNAVPNSSVDIKCNCQCQPKHHSENEST